MNNEPHNTTVKFKRSAAVILAFLMIAQPAFSTEALKVMFEPEVVDEGVELQLKGTATKSVIFKKAFEAGFYKDGSSQKQLLEDMPKRIEVEYFVGIPAYKMQNFTVRSMKENITEQEFALLSSKVDFMKRLFVDLKPGDRYSLTYIPGLGTKFAYNGEVTGIISGKDFQKALFSVWIGEKPFDVKIKRSILGDNV